MNDETVSKNDVASAWEYWYPLVYGYFFRRLNHREEVEDLTANTLNAFFMNPNVKNPKAYIWQTARLQLYKFLKNKYDTPSMVDFESVSTQGSMDDPSNPILILLPDMGYSDHYNERIQNLVECLKKYLPEKDYELVHSAITDNKSSQEIGEEFGLKPATVRQRIKRCFDKLRESCVSLWQTLTNSTAKEI